MNTSSISPSIPNPSRPAGWRIARRLLLAAAAVATLIAVFYTVENWRGKRAWENRRRELETKGEVVDWMACIPAPVPDDKNFFKAPKMQEWFVRESFATLRSQPANEPNPFALAPRKDTNLVLAEVKVVASNTSADSQPANARLRFDDPAAREQAAKLLDEALGPCVMGAMGCVLIAQPLEQFKPRLVLQSDTVPTVKELTALFPRNPLTNSALALSDINISYFQVDWSGSNTFRVSLRAPVYGAADYLSWTESLTANFDLVRKALERPYARIDCDYQLPFAIGIPNFVRIRQVVQILAQRAQCYLLLGHPDSAWHELALVHDLCQILKAKPSGKPMTLLAAMINVAVIGLYVDVVQEGLRLHAWREPQLLAIGRQLEDTDLLPQVVEAFEQERAGTCRTFEITKRGELLKLFNAVDSVSKFALTWMPRGWFYQNMAVGAELEQKMIGSMDRTNHLVLPRQVSEIVRSVTGERRSPYKFLVAIAFPNFAKAVQTLARTQTRANQALLACALERYRLAQGQYPETLAALTPRFLEQLPHDLIGGEPLKYRRIDGAGFLLYSVGWDEKDNGGVPGKTSEEGDWVWELH
jgi:hypothetical protein